MARLAGMVAIITGAGSGQGAAEAKLFASEGAKVAVVGPFLGMQAVRTAMRDAGGGAIVNVASVAGTRGFPGMAAYSGSKFMLRGH